MVLGKLKFLKISQRKRATQAFKVNWFFKQSFRKSWKVYWNCLEESLKQSLKTKTSQSLPPDEKPMLQAIKRIHYEIYYWWRVDEAIINNVLLQYNVWIVGNRNEEVRSLWFTGMFLISCFHFHSNQQIPPSLRKIRKNLVFLVTFLKRWYRQNNTCSYH